VLAPWQTDPLVEEQGSWKDVSCDLKKAFICQVYIATSRHSLTITGKSYLNGGVMEGGYLYLGYPSLDVGGGGTIDNTKVQVTSSATSSIINFSASRSASILLSASANSSVIGRLMLFESSLWVDTEVVWIVSGSSIGEEILESEITKEMPPSSAENMMKYLHPSLPMQSTVTFTQRTRNVHLPVDICLNDAADAIGSSYCNSTYSSLAAGSVVVNAALVLDGTKITIDDRVRLVVPQGGELSSSHVVLGGPSAMLALTGYGARLSMYDAFELVVAHSR
jgi:hypothetical protein